MSGHSKWAKIKRQKGVNDARRGALFTKLAKAISLAAQEGGGDPDMNFGLRLAIEKAKNANMPLDNIERAIKKGTGELEGTKIVRVDYEGVGPSGSAFIISASTDNTNRTVAEVRQTFETHGGSAGSSGSVAWQFAEFGIIVLKPAKLVKSTKYGEESKYVEVNIEELELELLDVEGIKDINIKEGEIEIITEKKDFAQVHKDIEMKEIQILSAELCFIPTNPIILNDDEQEKVISLMQALDDLDDVENVFANVEFN